MRLCVIFNPASARGRAARQLAGLRRALADADFRATARPGHAEELARAAAEEGFDAVAAAGGDGTAHEVAAGLLRAARPSVAFALLPIGSANDYAHALGLNLAAAVDAVRRGTSRRVDVGLARLAGRDLFFINTLGLGFSGAVTVESRSVRRLRGLMLYGLALTRALARHFDSPPMEITLDGQSRAGPTLSLTLALGRREGNFVVAPDAVLDDGLFDYLDVGAVSRWQVLRQLPRLARGTPLTEDVPGIRTGRCREARVCSSSALTVHLDGEIACLPADCVSEVEARVLPGTLRVLA